MKYKRRLFYLIIPFVVAVGLMAAADTTSYKTVYELSKEQRPPTLKDWLKDNEQVVTIVLALSMPLGGWLFHEYRKAQQQQQEVGRQQFLALATATITESVSDKLVAKLDLLTDKIEWVYKEINQMERQMHETDNELSQVRVDVTNLAADVKLLRATRKELLHRLNEQLTAVEGQLNDVINENCAGRKCDPHQSVKEPFDTDSEETLY